MAIVIDIKDIVYKNKLELKLKEDVKTYNLEVSSKNAQNILDFYKDKLTFTSNDEEKIARWLFDIHFDDIKNLLDNYNFNIVVNQVLTDFLVQLGTIRAKNLKSVVSTHQEKNQK